MIECTQTGNTPCKCYSCTGVSITRLVNQTREFLLQLDEHVEQAASYTTELVETIDDQKEEMYDLRETIANLTADKLVLEENKSETKTEQTKSKKGRSKQRQKQKASQRACDLKDGERTLVPVFGAKPEVQGGAFAVLHESSEPVCAEPVCVELAYAEPVCIEVAERAHANLLDNDGNPFCAKGPIV